MCPKQYVQSVHKCHGSLRANVLYLSILKPSFLIIAAPIRNMTVILTLKRAYIHAYGMLFEPLASTLLLFQVANIHNKNFHGFSNEANSCAFLIVLLILADHYRFCVPWQLPFPHVCGLCATFFS